jgi:hypothetical protein
MTPMCRVVLCSLCAFAAVESLHLDKLGLLDKTGDVTAELQSQLTDMVDKTVDVTADLQSQLTTMDTCSVSRNTLAAELQTLHLKLKEAAQLMGPDPESTFGLLKRSSSSVLESAEGSASAAWEQVPEGIMKTDATFYYIFTFASSIAQFVVKGLLANAGETGSTSPATAISTDLDCREAVVVMLQAVAEQTVTSPMMKDAADCIQVDMDKCASKIRILEWASTGIENGQSLLDTMYALKEIRDTQKEIRRLADEDAAIAEHQTNNKRRGSVHIAADHDAVQAELIQDANDALMKLQHQMESMTSFVEAR